MSQKLGAKKIKELLQALHGYRGVCSLEVETGLTGRKLYRLCRTHPERITALRVKWVLRGHYPEPYRKYIEGFYESNPR